MLFPRLVLLVLVSAAYAETGTIEDIKHIVIFMQENRAFDHYYGVMHGVRGFNDRAAPPLPSGKSPFHQPVSPPLPGDQAFCGCAKCDLKWTSKHSQIEAFLLDTRCGSLEFELKSANPPVDIKKGQSCSSLIETLRKSTYEHLNIGDYLSAESTCPPHAHVTAEQEKVTTDGYMLPYPIHFKNTSATCMPAPLMGYPSDLGIWNNGSMNAWNTAREPGFGMAFFNETDLPYYYALADGFTIGDQYFQSTFTATNPNRLHLFSGSNGLSIPEGKKGSGYDVLSDAEIDEGWEWLTLGEQLEDAGISWRVYQEENNFNDNAFAWFHVYHNKSSPLWKKGRYRALNMVDEFEDDIKNGKLPQVSWLIAPSELSEHATNHPQAGEAYTAKILKVLEKYPKVYKNTAFILNYDEGGQFYDHHWTPAVPLTPADGKSTVSVEGEITHVQPHAPDYKESPIGLGFRVPLMIISPWTRGGYVFSQVSDHTSVVQFIEKRWGIHCPNISPWRRAICSDLLAAFNFSNPDYSWPKFPDTTNYRKASDYQCEHNPPPVVPLKQKQYSQNPGVRPARPLPYEFRITASSDKSNTVTLKFNNVGKAGAAFYVYNLNDITQHPRKFTVEAGKQLEDVWNWGGTKEGYSLSVHGPNGYVRQLTSTKSPSVFADIFFDYEENDDDHVIISLPHPGCGFTVTDNAYKSGGPWKYQAGKWGQSHRHSVKASGNWYDLTLESKECGLKERFMGRLENPFHETTSDPAMSQLPPKEAAAREEANAKGHPDVHHLIPTKWERPKECASARSGWKDACWVPRDEL